VVRLHHHPFTEFEQNHPYRFWENPLLTTLHNTKINTKIIDISRPKNKKTQELKKRRNRQRWQKGGKRRGK